MGHLQDISETYWEHSKFAGKLGFMLLKAGVAALAHAIIPSLFINTASNTIKEINFLLESRNSVDDDDTNDNTKWFV
jgi:hypothetical protein